MTGNENDSEQTTASPSPARKKRGRPSKALVESKKKGNRGVRGRPPGDAAAIEEFKARLLASPKSQKVIDSILAAAMDDEHKNQAAAWKLLMDRLLPVSYFDKKAGGPGSHTVTINITGVDSPVDIQGETIDG